MNAPIAVWAQGNHKGWVIRSAVADPPNVVRFKVRGAISAHEWCWFRAPFTAAVYARKNVVSYVGASLIEIANAGNLVRRKHPSGGHSAAKQFVQRCALNGLSINNLGDRRYRMPWRRQTSATLTPGFSVSWTIARFCSSLKRRRFDRPSASCGVKRYLQRAQLAALLNWARALG